MWVLELHEESYDWQSSEILALSEDVDKLKTVALETAKESEKPVIALDWQERGMAGSLTAVDPDDDDSIIHYNIYSVKVV